MASGVPIPNLFHNKIQCGNHVLWSKPGLPLPPNTDGRVSLYSLDQLGRLTRHRSPASGSRASQSCRVQRSPQAVGDCGLGTAAAPRGLPLVGYQSLPMQRVHCRLAPHLKKLSLTPPQPRARAPAAAAGRPFRGEGRKYLVVESHGRTRPVLRGLVALAVVVVVIV